MSSENGQRDIQGTCKTNFQGVIVVTTQPVTLVSNHHEPPSSFPIVTVISCTSLSFFVVKKARDWQSLKHNLLKIDTPLEVPEKWWLGDYFALGKAYFQEGI